MLIAIAILNVCIACAFVVTYSLLQPNESVAIIVLAVGATAMVLGSFKGQVDL